MMPLPSGWGLASIGSLCDERIDQSGPSGPEFTYVDIGSVDNKRKAIVTPRLLPVESAPTRARQVLQAGDVIVSMTRPKLNAVALVPDHLAGAIGSTGFHVLRPWDPALSRWLFLFVTTSSFTKRLAARVQGVLYPAVRPADIDAVLVPVPPLAEQRRLVDMLDEALSSADAGKESLRHTKSRLSVCRSAVLKFAVDGRLTSDWRTEHPAKESGADLLQRILVERRERWEREQLATFTADGLAPPKNWKSKYGEPCAPMPVADQADRLPPGWTVASFDQLTRRLRTGNAASSLRTVTRYPILRSSAVKRGELDLGDVNYLDATSSQNTENFLHPGDFLVTRLSGSVEYVGCAAAVGDGYRGSIQYPDRIFRAVLSSEIAGRYLVFCFAHPHIRRLVEAAAKSTAGHQRISISDLRPLSIPLPPLAEQEIIVDLVEDQLSVIDHLERDIDAKLEQAGALRQSILRHAFTGQLVPQDPNDEPASVLLERIAAQRAAAGPAVRAKRPRRKRAAPKK